MGVGIATGIEFDVILRDFIEVSKLAQLPLLASDIETQILPAPHQRVGLPAGKMAVYVFFHGDTCLKVGKVGANSDARFRSQHYLPHASRSNLAKSLRGDFSASPDEQRFFSSDLHSGFHPESVADWMLTHLTRVHFFLKSEASIHSLNLLEIFLQCRLNPIFEGGNGG